MNMLSELKNRGIADALIVCCDGLKGLPDAIKVTWPDATVQTCVVHLVRNSLRAWEDFTPFLEYPLELRKIVGRRAVSLRIRRDGGVRVAPTTCYDKERAW
jgi:hypothetical protein